MDPIQTHALEDAVIQFRSLKELADKALLQISEEDFFRPLTPESNSLAILVKHVAGNLRSRWTDFLTTDGEKPDRNRDGEFVIEGGDTRERLAEAWERGWTILFGALAGVGREAGLMRTVAIRGEPHTVIEAVNRQLTHYGYHVGQIVLIARTFRREEWRWLSIPKGESVPFNESMKRKFAEGPGSPRDRDDGSDAEDLLKAVLDETRLRILSMLAAAGGASREEIRRRLDLTPQALARHLSMLEKLGIVRGEGDVCSADFKAIEALKKTAFARAAGPDEDERESSPEESLLKRFLAGDRIRQIPSKQSHRLVLLEWLAGKFEPGTRYPEREVNVIIHNHHPDHASLRRALVDHKLMERKDGVYWRVTGDR